MCVEACIYLSHKMILPEVYIFCCLTLKAPEPEKIQFVDSIDLEEVSRNELPVLGLLPLSFIL